MQKFIALFDLHFGWERGLERGKWVTRPTHNLPAIRAVMSFAVDFKPDVVVLGGDQLNCGPISHWHKGRPILNEGFRLRTEMDLLDNEVLKPFDRVGRKIWIGGNHEAWIDQFIEENPGTQGLLEPDIYLDLEKRGWEIYAAGEIARVGKLYFTHGDIVLRGGYANPAKTLVMAYRRNIRAGHLHTYSAAIEQTAVDAKDYHSGIIVPCLSTRAPFYAKNNPNQFINGFLSGYINDDGSFHDSVVIVNRNRFVVGGKEYK